MICATLILTAQLAIPLLKIIDVLQPFSIYSRKSKNVWIGLQRDATPTVFKWIDGSALTWAPLYADPWKDGGTPSTDVTKACIKMEWGSSLVWKDHDCASTEDFLCEGKNAFFVFNRVSEGNIGEMPAGGCQKYNPYIRITSPTVFKDESCCFVDQLF